MRVHLCGVRGSTPAPGPEFVRYGGHTSCLAVARDGGPPPAHAGRRAPGCAGPPRCLTGPFDGTILLTHLHWDHVHGLPFFTAGDRPDARVTLLLPEQDGAGSAEEVLARGMSPPHFPIGPGELRGRWSFGLLAAGELKAEGFTVEAAEIPHKGGRTFGYRVSDGHSVLAYLPDHGPTELGPGPGRLGRVPSRRAGPGRRGGRAGARRLLARRGGDGRAMLGHATADYAVELGQRAGARRVVLAHHRPDRTDDELDRLADRFAPTPA